MRPRAMNLDLLKISVIILLPRSISTQCFSTGTKAEIRGEEMGVLKSSRGENCEKVGEKVRTGCGIGMSSSVSSRFIGGMIVYAEVGPSSADQVCITSCLFKLEF